MPHASATSTPKRRRQRNERLSQEEEVNLAYAIFDAEKRVLTALTEIPEAQEVITTLPAVKEKTRAGFVDRLERAVEVAREHIRPATKKATKEAERAWNESDALRWKLAMSGRRIAVGEARKLASPFLDQEDLIQEGIIGLLRAAKRYEPKREVRFSTYARWWVRAQMTRAVDHTGRPIRLPGCAVEQRRNLKKIIAAYETSGTPYRTADLAGDLGVDIERVSKLMLLGNTISIEQPIDVGQRPRLLSHFMVDETAVDPGSHSIREQQRRRMQEALKTVLTEREQIVVTRRYGLDDGEFKTLAQIGSELNLSRERVRQIERVALIHLRAAPGLMDPKYERQN
jgi:RNA polymerase primary sigma factor